MSAAVAGRMDNVHGDEGGIDVEPFIERALEEVVECIMNFGEYPQPRRYPAKAVHREFDLYDFLFEENDKGQTRIDPVDAMEFFILAQKDQSRYGQFENERSRWEKKITAMLNEHLKDSDMVRDVATKYAEEEE